MVLVLVLFLVSGLAHPQVAEKNPPDLQAIDVIEHLGDTIDLTIPFINKDGESVILADYFKDGIPLLLTMHYSDCPMLCSMVLSGVQSGVNQLPWSLGKEYTMLSVSINPEESIERSKDVEARYNSGLKKSVPEGRWSFLTGSISSIDTLAAELGFKYFKVKDTGEYAHPAVLFVLSADGVISRYLYGLEFRERDLRLAITEAGEGKIGSTIDRIILYCFHYDPDAEGYVVMAGNVMQLGGIATLILMAVLFAVLWTRERAGKRSA